MSRLTLLGRPGCHLCEDARLALAGLGHSFDEVDIERDDELLRRWLEAIPVVLVDGREVCRFFIDASAIARALSILPGP
jgi:glutathione S-transferase